MNGLTDSWVDEGAALRIVKGSVLSAVGGSAIGGSIGVLTAKPGALFAYRMGINSFAFAFPFFCLREYLISPALTKALPHSAWANHTHSIRHQSHSNPHTRNLGSTAIAGAIVGSFFGAIKRGYRPIAFIKGATTFSLACTALQLTGNETRFWGRKLFFNSSTSSSSPESHSYSEKNSSISTFPNDQVSLPERGDQSKPFTISKSDPSSSLSLRERDSSFESSEKEKKDKNPSGFWSKFSLSKLAPVRKVSNEEYEEKLKIRLKGIEERLREVEAEIKDV